MVLIENFEDLIVWQKARILCQQIQKYVKRPNFQFDKRLISQLNGSSGSIMENIAEGFERDGNKEFLQFLYYSRGSNGEVRSQLYRALDSGYITQEEFDITYGLSIEIRKMTDSLIYKLKNSGFKGKKYK